MPDLAEAKYDLSRLSKEKFLFWGPPNSGKSWATIGFPKPMLILDFDLRINSIIAHPRRESGVTFEQFTNFDVAAKFLDKLWDDGGGKYRTVVLDSLTTLCESAIQHSVDNRELDNKGQPVGKHIGNWRLTDISDYGNENSIVTQCVDLIQKLPLIGILTAHYTTYERKILGKDPVKERVLLTGGSKLAAKLPAMFNEIYSFRVQRAQSGGYEYLVDTFNDGETFARTTIPGIPKTLKLNLEGKCLYEQIKETIENNNK